ncbi:Peptidase M8 [Trypanosoma melophagium]|uniref:Peptidase M8 n=1 Tax=Trypanosoma melophagium TaxID=715481 RepID=UPI00351A8E2F|nr:Peptidase M8 [Trypanosoma melophagium]
MLTNTSNKWRPIRIMASILDLNDPTNYCNESGVIRPGLRGDDFMCTDDSILTFEKRNLIIHGLIPEAVRLHTSRLLVASVNANLLIPLFNYPLCSSFTVPPDHRSVGVRNADMILYTAARPAPGVNIAWAKSCAKLKNGRPVAGVMNSAPHPLSLSRISIRITAHEIAHTLGFNLPQMVALHMVSILPHVRGKPFAMVVNSTLTREKGAGVLWLPDGGGNGVGGRGRGALEAAECEG